MTISTFDDLLREARAQPEPQRLLFVFTVAELPSDASADQRARFLAGSGGALAPLMYVDKAPSELTTFAALVDESEQFGPPWSIVFVGALAGHAGQAPTSDDAEAALGQMVEFIKLGKLHKYVAFDRQGLPVMLA
ncbi:MAG: ribonucleotide reductase subunit alpha [Acetobacteraceae bacterium]|nr:ribonucleotide reductase subunit alpha [Acetobacteraceae bacterium]